ncbi:MAG: GIY-YIG nuclease family protein [Flavobacteriaceae bacterium]|nr:GIY-YIG nuclease family protein [Flavobacteriaceae bacterium]
MYSVYVIYSSGYNRRYTGLTKDVEKRVRQHNAGENKSTKHYTPWKLILIELFESREEARRKRKNI